MAVVERERRGHGPNDVPETKWGIEEWAAWKASGRRMVTFVGMSGEHRIHATLLSVSKSGLRCRYGEIIERWHPNDVRPGHLA